MIAPAHENRRARCAARGDEGGKGGNDENKRQTHAHARESKAAHLVDVTDVNSVNDVIQHIYKLRDDGRYRELGQQLFDRLRAEKSFVVLHLGYFFRVKAL